MIAGMKTLMLEEIFACPIQIWMSKHGLTERGQRFFYHASSFRIRWIFSADREHGEKFNLKQKKNIEKTERGRLQ